MAMMAAEQWYQHQENYQKYGLDMKPRVPRKKPQPQKRTITQKDRVRILGLIVAIGILFIGLIITTAFAATIKYQTNEIIKENHTIQSEIENLNVKIYAATNIEAIETKAIEQGMVYPDSGQIVYLTSDKTPPEGFAQMMKTQAYN